MSLALPEHNFSLSGIGSKKCSLQTDTRWKASAVVKDRVSATLTSVQVTSVSMVMVSSFTQHCTVVQGGNASLN